jgi:paraquat-inducible protein A
MEIIACPDCDLLQHIPPLPPRGKARCHRCGHILAVEPANSLDRSLALTITAAIVFIIANTSPLMGISAVGRYANTTIAGGAYKMWIEGQEMTAMIIAFCAVIAPAGFILFMLSILVAVRRPRVPQWVGEVLRWGESMRPWSMLEVMMVGILVALVKIAELASVDAGIGMYAAGALVVLFTAIMVTFDPREVWKRVEWANGLVPERVGVHEAVRIGECDE